MTILIIGGTGVLSLDFLSLCSGKYDVYVMNRNNNASWVPDNVKVLVADIRDVEKVKQLIHDLYFDVVVDFLSYNKEQLEGTLSLFYRKFKHYIFISSADVYDRTQHQIISEKSKTPNQNWSYGIDKSGAEDFIRVNAIENNYSYTIVEPYITYGKTRIPYGLAPSANMHYTIPLRILHNKPLLIWGDGKVKCSIMHTRDFAYNLEQLLLNSDAYNQTFLLTSDFVYTWKQIADAIFLSLDKKSNIFYAKAEDIIKESPEYNGILLGDRATDALFDNSKIKNVINYKCSIELNAGIQETLSFYKNNNYLKGVDYKYDAIMDKIISRHSMGKFSLHFADYLGNASRKDRVVYFIYRYLPLFLVIGTKKIYNFCRAIFR
jgi:nucleoside-diphosphate-sugar epimerase